MKYRIIEIDRSDSDKSLKSFATPLTYRISITLENNEVVLMREYFYVGYNDGEKIDDFYYDDNHISRITFLTRNFDDDYLKEKEKEVIKIFYYKLIESEKSVKQEKINTNIHFDNKIKRYQKFQKCGLFTKLKRKEKLKKINK